MSFFTPVFQLLRRLPVLLFQLLFPFFQMEKEIQAFLLLCCIYTNFLHGISVLGLQMVDQIQPLFCLCEILFRKIQLFHIIIQLSGKVCQHAVNLLQLF